MILKNIIVISIIILNFVLILLILKKYKKYKECFVDNIAELLITPDADTNQKTMDLKSDYVDNLSHLNITENINVGKDPSINQDVKLGTNNTIFIEESIDIYNLDSSGNQINKERDEGKAPNNYTIDINTIKRIKSVPFHFKDKLCLGDDCINKYNIKMIKGDLGFQINNATPNSPITYYFYSEKDFNGQERIYQSANKLIEKLEFPAKSFKITDSSNMYTFTIYEKELYGGNKKEYNTVKDDNLGSIVYESDITELFKEGFLSIQANTDINEVNQQTCMKQASTHMGWALGHDDPDKFIQANNDHLVSADGIISMLGVIPCRPYNSGSAKSLHHFYFIRHDKLYNRGKHTHDDEADEADDIHFHEHDTDEEYHPVYLEKEDDN